ncbi:HAMP domain-containing sensor histidine kinase [Algoriphagus sp.]|uniref:sensor histidine kinase n=1 Tax=Algoriphagus sp. TaxID=1872435 RepID=UPI0032974010
MWLTKGLKVSEENFDNMEDFHKRITLTFTFLTFVLLLVLGVSDAILGMSPVIVFLKIGIAFPFLGTYFLVSKFGKTRIAIHILLLLGHLVVAFNFIYNDGSDGPTIYAFFLMLVMYTLLVPGWQKLGWFLLSFSIFFILFYAEAFGYLEVVHFYSTPEEVFVDHAVTILWISLFIFVLLHFFVKSYQNQNNILNSIKVRQDATLREVKMLNEQKNKLIAILSHDLKNPIGMLHTTLGLVEKDAFEPGEMEQILSNLKGQSFHLNKVLNNTLSWVMTELEDKPVQLHEISLMVLTHEMQTMMQVQAAEKNQKVEVSFEGEDQNISLEINEIKIILKNLLDNAIKFSPLNSVINLDLKVSKDKLSWTVRNQGALISALDQKDLFAFRARTSYGTKKEKGTGVGLPLCKRIADKIRFELTYSSTNDKQNSFTLTKKLV